MSAFHPFETFIGSQTTGVRPHQRSQPLPAKERPPGARSSQRIQSEQRTVTAVTYRRTVMIRLVKKVPDWLLIIVGSKLITSYFILTY
jgi:hypothetical protein